MKNEFTRRDILAVSAGLIVSPLALAETPKVETADGKEIVLKGGVELVNIMATVRDKNNRLIRDFKGADFRIFEDGKEQRIREFAAETKLPLMLGMLIAFSDRKDIYVPDEQRAGAKFFQRILRKGDRGFAATFGGSVEMLQDLTENVTELEYGLNHIGRMPQKRGIGIYDAIHFVCEQRLRGQNERKVLIVLSTGVDYGSHKSMSDAIKAAQSADVMIYTIAYPMETIPTLPPGRGGGFSDGFGGGLENQDSVMFELADSTGGRVFHTPNSSNLDRIYAEIEAEVRSQYSISYSPASTVRNGKFRKIEVRAVNKEYKVQARKGYYAGIAPAK